MRKLLLTFLAALVTLGIAAQEPVASSVPGDPMATQCYTLSNGLKVFLSVNHQSPRISAHIAVRTGSRNDPAETTGLAHYLEHLMFKGTKQYGTSNYAAEKALLDTIEARYEQYRLVKDPERRRVLYHEIDSISQLAAQYNIKFAIHNHGANPKTGNPDLYATVVSTYEYIKDLDPRMGFCMDIAYTHADGLDVAEVVRTYHKRIFDGHVRNINPGNNGSAGVSAPNGVIAYRPIFEALRDVGYDGCLGLELANAFGKYQGIQGDPLWIPESLGYFRAMIDSLR